MIKTASECSIKVFIDVMFNGNFSALKGFDEVYSDQELKEVWQEIYMEYVDMSGLAQTTEFYLMKYIYGLECRITMVKTAVNLHRECIRLLGEPFYPAFKELKKYGHALWWSKENPDEAGFLKKLDSVISKEKRYDMDLEEKYAELFRFKDSIKNGDPSEKSNRKDFIRVINQISKHFGFKLDWETTTIEELAVMQCDYNSACESLANSK